MLGIVQTRVNVTVRGGELSMLAHCAHAGAKSGQSLSVGQVVVMVGVLVLVMGCLSSWWSVSSSRMWCCSCHAGQNGGLRGDSPGGVQLSVQRRAFRRLGAT
jgi:hypothetical protein